MVGSTKSDKTSIPHKKAKKSKNTKARTPIIRGEKESFKRQKKRSKQTSDIINSNDPTIDVEAAKSRKNIIENESKTNVLTTPEVWSKSKKKRMRKLLSNNRSSSENISEDVAMTPDNTANTSVSENDASKTQQAIVKKETKENIATISSGINNTASKGMSSLQKAFLARLSGSRFRELNEDLYTSTSSVAFAKFSSQPDLYEQYHEGFRHQVESWPINPVNLIVDWLVSSLPKYTSRPVVVADFGCGDAALAKKLLSTNIDGNCPFHVHCFDLVACCDLVTACDMANVPLESKSVDVAIFCLSLMGTNLADFLREAHRVLKPKGILKIAEVRSRFESTKDELEDFITVLHKLGFACVRKDRSNKMFVMLELKLNGKSPDQALEFQAKPCIYKRR
jgi:SAM-dependent methyltransferase